MPLSLNEIRERARAFAKEWAGESSERAEAQSFWNEFFNVFGVNRRRVAVFEQKAARFTGSTHGRIDVFWPGVMLAEHKSEGRDLDAAFQQATDYFAGLKDAELPRFVLVSDFQRFRLHDLETGERSDFALAELHKQIGRFGFISGYQTRSYKEEDPVNVQAAERMGRLHDALKAAGYDGHALELLLVRLLFCLFADDTGIFPRQSFHELIAQRTSEDGADLGMWVGRIFQVLNTPPEKRQTTLDEQLAELPYVNGRLFDELLPLADFNAQMRGLLLDASTLDWSRISPAIFGSMFQSVMDSKARRNLGAHYTSEKNILKLIGPLFLDGLKAELDKAGHDQKKLAQLHRKLATLTFLDPACGCGNFLVIAYRELRALELEVLTRQFATQQSVLAHVQDHVLVDVDQFHGIEIEEFPAQIAQVAMWLMDHQMNLRVSEQFGENVVRLPLKKSATIVHGNALRIDWNDVVPAERLNYILGNPPFIGHQWRNAEQMADMERIWGNDGRFGRLDYVTAWYRLATDYMRTALDRHSRESGNRSLPVGPEGGTRCAFVSTNSICQGEQVGILWGDLLARGVHLHFGHRTFQWTNEARGNAAVHCVIVGFGLHDVPEKWVFEYETPKSEALAIRVDNVNPYLVGGPNVLLPSRTKPQPGMPEMYKGSQPTDGGHLILTDEEKRLLLAEEPAAEKFVRRYIGGDELINGGVRWCLWLKHASPSELSALPKVRERVAKVRGARLKSPTKQVRDYAEMPTLFTQDRQPEGSYVAVPEVSSENRRFIPIAFLDQGTVASNKIQMVVGGTLYHFGVLTSTMHMAWMRAVAGRLESRYSYAPAVYNNFPWPELPGAAHKSDGTDIRLSGAARLRGNDEQERRGNDAQEERGITEQVERGNGAQGEHGNEAQAARVHDAQGHKHRAAIEAAAQAVLDARAQFPDATLADLYDPLTMPPALVKAHAALDKAVDAAYLAAEKAAGRKPPRLDADAERVAFLFQRYQALTSLLPAEKPRKAKRRTAAADQPATSKEMP